jgi:hypothetical protein
MSDKLLKGQYQVSAQTPMPVDPMDSSSTASTYSEAAVVQFYYYNAGTRTIDAGQAAGTIVDGVFSYRNIYDSLGATIACKKNTSLAFTCNAMTTEIDASANPALMQIMEGNDTNTPAEKAAAIGAFLLNNGDYVVDYRKGVVWVKKATTTVSMASVSYKITSASATTSSAITSVIPGTAATNLGKAEDAAHTSGDVGVMMLAVRNDAGTVLAGTTGDYIPLSTDPNGNLRVATGSGGSAGGGNNTYSTEQGDFTATVTNASNAIVLSVDSIGGVALTTANFANGILKVQDVSATPDEWKTITLDKFTWTAATKTLDTAGCTGAFTFGTGDIVSLVITGSDKMRDSANDATRNLPVRDCSDQFVEQSVVDTTNVASGTYYPSSSGQATAGYKDLTFTGTLIDGAGETTTLTLEVSNIGGTTAGDWVQVYFRDDKNNTNVNSIAATNQTTTYACSAPGVGKFDFYRYLITTSASTNTVEIAEKLTW